jgi:hypothetical protein
MDWIHSGHFALVVHSHTCHPNTYTTQESCQRLKRKQEQFEKESSHILLRNSSSRNTDTSICIVLSSGTCLRGYISLSGHVVKAHFFDFSCFALFCAMSSTGHTIPLRLCTYIHTYTYTHICIGTLEVSRCLDRPQNTHIEHTHHHHA